MTKNRINPRPTKGSLQNAKESDLGHLSNLFKNLWFILMKILVVPPYSGGSVCRQSQRMKGLMEPSSIKNHHIQKIICLVWFWIFKYIYVRNFISFFSKQKHVEILIFRIFSEIFNSSLKIYNLGKVGHYEVIVTLYTGCFHFSMRMKNGDP